MIQVKNLKNWNEFEKELEILHGWRKAIIKKTSEEQVSQFLFRGQANADWTLKTTLERCRKNCEWSLDSYYQLLKKIKPHIKAFSGKDWQIHETVFYGEIWENAWRKFQKESLPSPELLSYLRHYGFPSPLLDWTSSSDISAYFAFSDIKDGVDQVAIWVFLEHVGQGKIAESHKANLSTIGFSLGPPLDSNDRHIRQKSQYSCCTKYKDQIMYFASHDECIPFTADDAFDQDRIWQFNLPSCERKNVLKHLDSINVNSFSLFGTAESLMETLALKEIVFHE